jgi:hypothetical protein
MILWLSSKKSKTNSIYAICTKVAILDYSFIKHSEGILGVKFGIPLYKALVQRPPSYTLVAAHFKTCSLKHAKKDILTP